MTFWIHMTLKVHSWSNSKNHYRFCHLNWYPCTRGLWPFDGSLLRWPRRKAPKRLRWSHFRKSYARLIRWVFLPFYHVCLFKPLEQTLLVWLSFLNKRCCWPSFCSLLCACTLLFLSPLRRGPRHFIPTSPLLPPCLLLDNVWMANFLALVASYPLLKHFAPLSSKSALTLHKRSKRARTRRT